MQKYDYLFSENGLVAHKKGNLLAREVFWWINKFVQSLNYKYLECCEVSWWRKAARLY